MGWYVGIPFPRYALFNNNAEINRTKKRITCVSQMLDSEGNVLASYPYGASDYKADLAREAEEAEAVRQKQEGHLDVNPTISKISMFRVVDMDVLAVDWVSSLQVPLGYYAVYAAEAHTHQQQIR